jgi:16S rRNA (cytosine967-C5)-methyltransferase
MIYAVCSILSREGSGAIADFQARRSSWMKEEPLITAGRPSGEGRLLSPGHDGTDGFFIAPLRRPC